MNIGAGILVLYFTIGLLFALAFVFKGATQIDDNARSTGVTFRLMILPGATLLWPYLLQRWLRGAKS